MGALTGTLSPSYLRHLERKPADPQFRRVDAGRLTIGGEALALRALPDMPCRFDVYRADELRTSSTLFAGGDWRWQLSDAAGEILVEAGGYRSETQCQQAVAMLQRHVPGTPFPTRDGPPQRIERKSDMDMSDNSPLAQERHLATTEERTVLALEMIADHLEKISRGLVPIGDARGGDATFEGMAESADGRGGADRWDSENEHAGAESPEAPGVEQALVEHFAVGGYNYTNLAHAIAEAKRDRRNGERR